MKRKDKLKILNKLDGFKSDAEYYENSEISPQRELAIDIIDEFEGLLEENNIIIPDEDREGDETEARIYGSTYYFLEDKITELIENFLKGGWDEEVFDTYINRMDKEKIEQNIEKIEINIKEENVWLKK